MSALIDLKELLKQYLEPDWAQGGRLRAWLAVYLAPLRTLNTTVEARRAAAVLELRQTGQQGPLQALLNDRYDPTFRGILLSCDAPGEVTVRVPFRVGLTGEVLLAFEGDLRARIAAGRVINILYVP